MTDSESNSSETAPTQSESCEVVALTAAFDQQVRPFLDIIDRLRAFGIESITKMSLPRIVMIGDQSSGKSSVVEALSGICLPRGTGMVTRAPLELRMIKSPNWSATLSYKVGEKETSIEVESPDDVDKAVRDAQEDLTSPNEPLTDVEIHLEVQSPNVPDLTVVDLPGIVRANQNFEKKIKKLIQSYIEPENTIILVVCPANNDIEVNEVVTLAKMVDPDGKRTIGVVTKPDLVDEGTEANIVKLVDNESAVRLQGESPWTLLKGRSQKDIVSRMTLEEAKIQETAFFSEHPTYKFVDKDKLGLDSLATKLTKALVGKCKTILPELKTKVNQSIVELQDRLFRLGDVPSDDIGEVKMFFMNLTNAFSKDLIAVCSGEDQKLSQTYKVFQTAREFFSDFVSKIDDDSFDIKHDQAIECLREIIRSMQNYRGNELPNYGKYEVVKQSILNLLKKFNQPMLECSNKVSELVDRSLRKMTHEKLRQFPKLDTRVRAIMSEVTKKSQSDCNEDLRKYMFMEEMIYVLGDIYCGEVDLIHEDIKDIPQEILDQYSPSRTQTQLSKPKGLANAVLVRRRINAVLADLDDPTKIQAKKHLTTLIAYHRMVSRRMKENVPMKVQYFLLKKLSQDLRKEIIKVQAEAMSSTTLDDSVMSVNEDLRHERRQLMDKLKKLETCQEELNSFLFEFDFEEFDS